MTMNNLVENLPPEVASLLIPMHGEPLILPNVSVAEIVPLTDIEMMDDTPGWYLGLVEWRGVKVPLLSFESLNGDALIESNEFTRMAVINGTQDVEKLPFYGLMVQGIPRLVRVFPEEIGRESPEEGEGDAEAMHVVVNGEKAVIPDLEKIEKRMLMGH